MTTTQHSAGHSVRGCPVRSMKHLNRRGWRHTSPSQLAADSGIQLSGKSGTSNLEPPFRARPRCRSLPAARRGTIAIRFGGDRSLAGAAQIGLGDGCAARRSITCAKSIELGRMKWEGLVSGDWVGRKVGSLRGRLAMENVGCELVGQGNWVWRGQSAWVAPAAAVFPVWRGSVLAA
jgi:hypothetical protein